MQNLSIHQKSAHPEPVAAPGHHQPHNAGNGNAKVDKKVRPNISPQMTEENWRFLTDEWSRYKRQTGIKDQQLLDELWSCMTEELRQLAFAEGGSDNLTTEADMMTRIKKLAVVSLHPSVHVVTLHELKQQSDENVKTFAARVKGVAASCGLQKVCTSATCQQVIQYVEETCYHVVLAGLTDQSMKERALTQAMMNTIKDLNSLVTWCTADEGGRLGIPGSTIGRIKSGYVKQQTQRQSQKCNYCGGKSHSDESRATRSKECRAFGKTCAKCDKQDHFSTVCRKKSPGDSKPANTAGLAEDPANDAINGALNFFAINLKTSEAFQVWRPWEEDYHAKSTTATDVPEPFEYAIPTQNRFTMLTDETVTSDSEDSLECDDLPTHTNTPHPAKRQLQEKLEQPGPPYFTNILPTHTSDPLCPPSSPMYLQAMVDAMNEAGVGQVRTLPLPHMLHDVHTGWIKSRPAGSPSLPLTIKLHAPSYRSLGLDLPTRLRRSIARARAKERGIMDTGAQMTLCPASFIKRLGIDVNSLIPLQSRINSASQDPISLLGGLLVEVAWTSSVGDEISCLQLMYVSNAVSEIYMSKDACVQLGVISSEFPIPQFQPSSACSNNVMPAKDAKPATVKQSSCLPSCTNTGVILPGDEVCSCPPRTLPPTDKPSLPCSPIAENLPLLKEYIIKRYAASAFNICERQPLPLMEKSPPLRLFVNPEATPVAIKSPAVVPLHWQEAVKGGLDRDVRLGVLQKIDVNVPDTWTSRMIITPKPNSDQPRRVVDFQPVNSQAARQTHHTSNPYQLVASVPPNQVKSVLDCWHGYHSVPIAKHDQHLTTFLTPWGRYKYLTTPQGFLSAGDGYTHRADIITADVPRLRKCIDDSLLFDDDIQTNFYRVCDYLELCSRNGMVFNASKFQFASTTVQYVGFMVTPDGIKPTKDFMDNIRSFPVPQNITDVRSWYGAVAQISYTFSVAPAMAPFRHLLSSKVPFQWSPDLQAAFELSKEEILKQCMQGVKSFDPARQTALATDWSKVAMGFWLCQKHCNCDSLVPGCCNNGWYTVHCGSKFCSPAQSRYAPIEGEATAATWGLDKCKFFLLGMNNFILALDHKPLIGMFGRQELVTIPNPRLISNKLKTMQFKFTPMYIPGKKHVVPDCLSRRSVINSPIIPGDSQALLDTSNILPEYQDHLGPPSWVTPPAVGESQQNGGILGVLCLQPDDEHPQDPCSIDGVIKGMALSAIAALNEDPGPQTATIAAVNNRPTVLTWTRLTAAATSCPVYKSLHKMVSSGASDDQHCWPPALLAYYPHRKALVTIEDVVMMHDRPVIPQSLREEVLEHLHAGHAGVTYMYSRATSCMYWPNMRVDIVKMRASCSLCNIIAPSNPSPPPHPVINPAYPFSDICADFFEYSGKSYLATVDRYSNWLSLFQLAHDNSANVIKTFRELCCCWGVPKTITTDGASVFTSAEMTDWLSRWGIQHRLSSSYYPRANKRAEVAVKSTKRLIMDNLGPNGTLHTDKLARAILMHRNCPDPNTGLSPAQVIFGRVLRDHIPLQPGKFEIREEWRVDAELRARALAKRHLAKHEDLSRGSKPLPKLSVGDSVMIQDQTTNKPGRWTKTGVIVENQGFDSYTIKVDGSNNVTKRNRKFLRLIIPYIDAADDKSHTTPGYNAASPPITLPLPPIEPVQELVEEPVQDPAPAQDPVPDQPLHPDTQQPPQPPQAPENKSVKKYLPPHLRHKWIVNPKLVKPKNQ